MRSEGLEKYLKTRKEGVEFNPSYLPNLEEDWKDCISEEHRQEIQDAFNRFMLNVIITLDKQSEK